MQVFHQVLAGLLAPEALSLGPYRFLAGGAARPSERELGPVFEYLARRIGGNPDSDPTEDRRVVKRRVESVLRDVKFDPLRLLDRLSRVFLTERDGLAAFRFWTPSGTEGDGSWQAGLDASQKLALWRDLTLCMDTTPVLAAFYANNRVRLGHVSVARELDLTLNDLEISSILDRGLAETHLHLSAGFSFRRLTRLLMDVREGHWHRVVKRLAADPRPVPGLECSAVEVLAELLHTRLTLLRWAAGVCFAIDRDRVADGRWLTLSWWGPGLRPWAQATPSIYGYVGTVRRLLDATAAMSPLVADQIRRLACNETAFLTYEMGLHRTLDAGAHLPGLPDPRVAASSHSRVMLRYLQLKNALYRAVVQDRGRYGFAAFRDRFRSMSPFSPADRLVVDELSGDNRLQRLEVRISPTGKTLCQLRDKLLDLLDEQRRLLVGVDEDALGDRHGRRWDRCRYQSFCPVLEVWSRRLPASLPCPDDHPGRDSGNRARVGTDAEARSVQPRNCRLGIVLHFIKPDREPPEEGSWFAVLQREVAPHLSATASVYDMVKQAPSLTSYVVGLDVANVETSLPGFAFFPFLTILREAWRLGGRAYPGGRQSLGLTFHAGEDFFDVRSGLRTIWEVMNLLDMRPGDRLGHAAAAGLDIEQWCRQHSPSTVTLEDDVHDRLWMWNLAVRAGGADDLGELMEPSLRGAIGEWLGTDSVVPADLLLMLRLRHEGFHARLMATDRAQTVLGARLTRLERDRQRQRLGDELWSAVARRYAEGEVSGRYRGLCRLMQAYFEDPRVRARGRRLRHVVHQDATRRQLMKAQRWVCEEIARRGVTVEGNLTSNYVILRMDRVEQHPIYRWCLPDGDLNTGFRVSVNTDNPAIFNTRLEVEYALLFQGARQHQLSRREATALVERVRRESLDSSFVRRRFATREAELMHLCHTIRALRQAGHLSPGKRGPIVPPLPEWTPEG